MTRDSLMVTRSAWAGCCWLLHDPGILMPASPNCRHKQQVRMEVEGADQQLVQVHLTLSVLRFYY